MNITDPIFHDEAKARAFFEKQRWPDGPVCPFCDKQEAVQRLGGAAGAKGTIFCKACRKKFSVSVGTVMESSHIPLNKWLFAFRIMASSKKGVSAHQVHRMLGITYKSAWFLCHRITAPRSASRMKPALTPRSRVPKVSASRIDGLVTPRTAKQKARALKRSIRKT